MLTRNECSIFISAMKHCHLHFERVRNSINAEHLAQSIIYLFLKTMSKYAAPDKNLLLNLALDQKGLATPEINE